MLLPLLVSLTVSVGESVSVLLSLSLPPVTIPPGPWLRVSVLVDCPLPPDVFVLESVSVSLVLTLSDVVLPPASPVESSCSWLVPEPVSLSFSVKVSVSYSNA